MDYFLCLCRHISHIPTILKRELMLDMSDINIDWG